MHFSRLALRVTLEEVEHRNSFDECKAASSEVVTVKRLLKATSRFTDKERSTSANKYDFSFELKRVTYLIIMLHNCHILHATNTYYCILYVEEKLHVGLHVNPWKYPA